MEIAKRLGTYEISILPDEDAASSLLEADGHARQPDDLRQIERTADVEELVDTLVESAELHHPRLANVSRRSRPPEPAASFPRQREDLDERWAAHDRKPREQDRFRERHACHAPEQVRVQLLRDEPSCRGSEERDRCRGCEVRGNAASVRLATGAHSSAALTTKRTRPSHPDRRRRRGQAAGA